jgi:hypothetical protein
MRPGQTPKPFRWVCPTCGYENGSYLRAKKHGDTAHQVRVEPELTVEPTEMVMRRHGHAS